MAINWIYLREEENVVTQQTTEKDFSKEELDPKTNSSASLQNKASSALTAAKGHGKDAVIATKNAARAKAASLKAAQREKKEEKERIAQQTQDLKNGANSGNEQAPSGGTTTSAPTESALPVDNSKIDKEKPIKKRFSKDFTTDSIINELDIDEDSDMGFIPSDEESENALDEFMNFITKI